MQRRQLMVGSVLLLVTLVSGCGGGGSSAGSSASGEVKVGSKSAPPQRSTAFTIVSQARVDGDGRKRLQAKLTLASGLTTDQSIEAIRGAIQELLPPDGEVEVVEVLVYRTEAETSGNWTVGRGFASKDGKGWRGDGRFEAGRNDRNNIDLDLKMPNNDIENFNLAR